MNTTIISSAPACSQCFYSPQLDSPPALPSHSTRINHLLDTNEVPTEEEKLAFQAFIAVCQPFLAHLDTRFASVQAIALEIKAHKESFASTMSEIMQALNPVRRLPKDILKLIFRYGAEYDKAEEEYFASVSHSLDLRSLTWVFGRVCRRWRHLIIYEWPEYWTRIKLQLERPGSPKQLPLAQSLLSIFLHRSQNLPLTVCVSIPYSFPMDLAAGFLNILFAHSRRWKSLFLSGGQRLNEVLFVPEDSFPSLERIQIRDTIHRKRDTRMVFPIVHASNLKSWTSVGNSFSTSVRLLPPSAICQQITDYTISGVSSSEVIKVIHLFPCLRVLAVQDLLPNTPHAAPFDVRLPDLVQLCIRQHPANDYPESAITALLDSLLCPALVHLSLYVGEKVSESVQKFEERSQFALQHFIVGEDAAAFVKGFRNCLALERIDIKGNYNYQSIHDVLAFLYAPSTTATLTSDVLSLTRPTARFPNLRRLQFYLSAIPFVDAFMESAYANMGVRMFYPDLVVPLELVITTPKEQAKKMLEHQRLKNFRSIGVAAQIIATLF
ncbi:hypothetical protein EV360DRAFT_79733 [Lentinula raphanica]|nr:hypothetical protein EV360DRAFT_79733 [Lentinula raphanica]